MKLRGELLSRALESDEVLVYRTVEGLELLLRQSFSFSSQT
jgi:hypothetical protein